MHFKLYLNHPKLTICSSDFCISTEEPINKIIILLNWFGSLGKKGMTYLFSFVQF